MKGLICRFVVCLVAFRASAQTPPTITVQPASQQVSYGGTAIFSVAVSGTGPFEYQWRLNGLPLAGEIVTVAGGGTNSNYGGSPNGVSATNASLYQPAALAFDRLGNLYLVNSTNLVLKMDTNNILTAFAGTGQRGEDSGDGGPATNAILAGTKGLAVDNSGNVYISDRYPARRVRRVDTNGIITTVAGNGQAGHSGDGGPAIDAELDFPTGLAVDAIGNLFIRDEDYLSPNSRIRKVDTNGVITTVANISGYGDYELPVPLALDPPGNLYFAVAGSNSSYSADVVQRLDTNGLITTSAGGGPIHSPTSGLATKASFVSPITASMFDHQGNLYIADASFTIIAGDSGYCGIFVVNPQGYITPFAGSGTQGFSGDGGPAIKAEFEVPGSLAMGPTGGIFISDTYNNRIREVLPEGPTYAVANVGTNK